METVNVRTKTETEIVFASVRDVNYPPLSQGACGGGPLRGTGLQFNGCEG